MRRIFTILTVVLAISVFAGCSKPVGTAVTGDTSTGSGVAAVVGDVKITAAELNTAAESQLKRLETEVYRIKKNVLDGMVDEKLIEQAAKKKSMSVEKYLAEEVDAKVTEPTDEQLKAIYESGKDRIGKSYDDAKKELKEFVKQNNKMRLKNDLIASLKKDTNVKIDLEPPRVVIDIKGLPTVGDKDAKVTLVEFSDYQCPFCKRVRPTIWRLLDEYKGKLRYAFGDFPLSFHKESKKAHEAARCAGDQGKYFEYNRKIFDNQTAIKVEDLKKYAKELQLNTKKFDSCLDTDKFAKAVEESTAKGASLGVSGTPAYFINGIMLSGAMPYESFKDMIDTELNK